VRDAVREAAARIPVIIATGRMYRSALPWALELQVRCPLVCYQGALVRELPEQGGAVLHETGVAPQVTAHALTIAREHGWHFQAYADDDLYCEQERPEGALYTRISGIECTLVPDLMPIILRHGSTKGICVVTDPGEAQRCRDVLTHALGASARITPSRPEFIEIVSPAVSKAAACAIVCERAGVTLDHAVAIGDGPNDNEMLDAAGYAVAVAPSSPEVLAHADVRCAPPQDAGVADVLERLNII